MIRHEGHDALQRLWRVALLDVVINQRGITCGTIKAFAKILEEHPNKKIAAPYRDRDGKVVGVLGVIGPTRLNYARVVPMVDFTARSLGKRIG